MQQLGISINSTTCINNIQQQKHGREDDNNQQQEHGREDCKSGEE